MAETRKVRETTAEPKPAGNRGKGRKKGVPNKATAEIKAIAQEYGAQAVQTLAEMMLDSAQPGKTRVSAANALLDRGYGKPAQPIDGDGEGGPIKHLHELSDEILLKIAAGKR